MSGLDSIGLCGESSGLQADAPSPFCFRASPPEPLISQRPTWNIGPLIVAWEVIPALGQPKPAPISGLFQLSLSPLAFACLLPPRWYLFQPTLLISGQHGDPGGVPSLWVPVMQHQPLSEPLIPPPSTTSL